jgi:phosphate transport system substrate-binding protein
VDTPMSKTGRIGSALSLVATAVLLLSSCAKEETAPAYASSATVDCGGKQSLTASGSSAQANAMKRFVDAYEKTCAGDTLTYTSNGSGAGVSEFLDNKTDFGGSDSPLNAGRGEYAAAKQRCGSDAWNLPVVFGPLGITFNLNAADTLVLDGPTVAKIFNGTITRWNDPAITALNASMPAEDIHVVYRSDDSGTTDNFQQYLDAASDGAWGKGTGKTFHGGAGVGAKGNEGTSALVKNTEGAISYNEYSFAQAQRLPTAKILTPAGTDPVGITADSVTKTVASATISGQGNDLVVDTGAFYEPTQPGAYPIMLATYEIVCSKYADAPTGQAVRAFLQSTIGQGQADLEDFGYFPLPPEFQSKVAAAVNAVA